MSRTSETAERESLRHALSESLPTLLPAFLAGQRWFGGKGRPLRSTALEDVAWLPASAPAALCVASVAYEEGPSERYLMLLGWASEPRAGVTLGRGEGPAGRPWLIESSGEPDTISALLRGLCAPATIGTAGGGELIYADVDPADPACLAPEMLEWSGLRLLGVEQSNTTLRVGPRHVFKMFRRLEPGENPEVEMTRFLTRAGRFGGCPALRGSIGYRRPGSAIGTVGVLEDWVENQGDGWSSALALLARGDGKDGIATLRRDLEHLGRITAEFHAALASDRQDPDFAPEPFAEADRAACATAMHTRAERVVARLRRARTTLVPELRSAVDRLVEAEASLATWTPPSIEGQGAGFTRIRIHGDYHLGQTLKTAGGYVVIDLEGEPAIPRADRRSKQPALRDVAGMLRSFDYAAAASTPERPEIVGSIRTAFLRGYDEGLGGATADIVPAAMPARDGWIRFFELSKALYEAEYELDNRPAWLGIPLRGIERLLARDSTDGGRP